jgi:hypothetical protein
VTAQLGIFDTMHPLRFFLYFIFATTLFTAWGQTRTYSGKKLSPMRSYNNPSSVRAKTGSAVPLFDEAGFPYQGIGIKLGDPMALTFKFYFSERLALEADFGRTLSALYGSYYQGLFDLYFPDPADVLTYSDHSVSSDWVGNLKLLYHVPAGELAKGLRFYAGPGWQVRDGKIDYTYSDTSSGGNLSQTTRVPNQTQGITLTAGVEYSNFDGPVVLFAEGVLFFDLDQDRGWTRLQGGVGVRFVF